MSRVNRTAPIHVVTQFRIPDGTLVYMDLWFIAMEDAEAVKKVMSFDSTGFWINEARGFAGPEVLEGCTSRWGRYPSPAEGGRGRKMGILDTNAMDEDHWFYKLFEEMRPARYELFKQPPAVLDDGAGGYIINPKAENLCNLGADYWLSQVLGKSKAWIKVYLKGQYGLISYGVAVYQLYDDNKHCGDVRYIPGAPIFCGLDFGLTPAIAIGQRQENGALHIIDELVIEKHNEMGVKRFAATVVLPHIRALYPNSKRYCWADPSGRARSQGSEKTNIRYANDAGLYTRPARSNVPEVRHEAVNRLLSMDLDGEPGLKISPKAKFLRKGLRGNYYYDRIRSADGGYKNEPKKNIYSHVCDGLQYLCQMFDTIEGESIDEELEFKKLMRKDLNDISRAEWDEHDRFVEELREAETAW